MTTTTLFTTAEFKDQGKSTIPATPIEMEWADYMQCADWPAR